MLVAHHVVRPARYGYWLRRDVPHLAVVFGDTTLTVGPFVQPGAEAPCLCCLDLARQDADPAWQAIATQLAYRPPSSEEPVARLLGAAVAGSAIDRWLRTGESGLSRDGHRHRREDWRELAPDAPAARGVRLPSSVRNLDCSRSAR